ncbi:MFS transporter, DHA3 family, multidrug efflux protein [Micromonospora pattaloongensis]|uniref:MFS transporter, DHA3 family, multidrug efflux protein n=1 Tax=Micromonospora pattaloongensis TaxID=405436 RepID=A0A1H3NI77_9ACTN|nr:MFS transporter [Micromonospora pattaloongensis]SDY88591.1 MFS transporter, DHA3 family, multidrug efflux protein [Micromonospora pattaloongensis]
MSVIHGDRKTFYALLFNTLLVSVINYTVWFAITFYVYLQTRSVFATGVVSGIFLVTTALTGIWFGSLVDHYRKKTIMQVSAAVSAALYTAAFAVYQTAPQGSFTDATSVRLWTLIVLLTVGVIAGNIRTIALSTLVTVLMAEDSRDRANGLVGTTSGVSFLVTSVISGLLVAAGGMFWVLLLALAVLGLALLHLALVPVPERTGTPLVRVGATPAESSLPPEEALPAAAGGPAAAGEPAVPATRTVDLRGTIRVVGEVPGLMALIFFSAFNNFLGGVFMALMDAYGLSLMSVQAWGLLWGVLSTGFIVGGLLIARTGLGKNPVWLLLFVNLVLWTVTMLFPLRASVVLLAVGMYVYMVLVPYAEAAEQTILQKVVPYERQGRVFGFAQSVEQAASPLTAFLISPIAQFVFIPFMTDGRGAGLIGGWFGTGADRGLALIFVLTGIIGLIATTLALRSAPYRRLSRRYTGDPVPGAHV